MNCATLCLLLTFAAGPADASKSAAAVEALRQYLADNPGVQAGIIEKYFASVPLTRADAAAAREMLWKAHAAAIEKERAAELKDRVLKDGNQEMPFAIKTFGKKPAAGHSLWISLHGGGGTTKKINDQQWENQKKLYSLDEGLYLAPRSPGESAGMWHTSAVEKFFSRLVEDLIVIEKIDPDRVYVLGYSAGGDGVYQLAPRLADRWAAAAMMAGHPNGVPLLSLRNLPFALQVGEKDDAYSRNKVGKEYGEKLAKLRADDPTGYEHFVKIHEGKGHWMNLEDKAALPWMAKFSRNPVPDKVVWKQCGTPQERLYWLAVPKDEAKLHTLVVAERKGQAIEISKAEQMKTLRIRLDDRMANLDEAVMVTSGGKQLYKDTPSRTIATMLKTLIGRGDPKLIFDAEIEVQLPAK